jgi:hypothetical protein
LHIRDYNGRSHGFVSLIYSNGCDVISDCGISAHGASFMARAEALAEELRAKEEGE